MRNENKKIKNKSHILTFQFTCILYLNAMPCLMCRNNNNNNKNNNFNKTNVAFINGAA